MKPSEFVQIGGKIVAFGPAGARTAISRAYYGAFHECRATLSRLGIQSPGSGVAHTILPNYFQTAVHPEAIQIGFDLSDLHTYRVQADYSLDAARFEELSVAQNAIVVAVKLLRSLEQYERTCLADDAVKQDLLQAVAKVDSVRQVRKQFAFSFRWQRTFPSAIIRHRRGP